MDKSGDRKSYNGGKVNLCRQMCHWRPKEPSQAAPFNRVGSNLFPTHICGADLRFARRALSVPVGFQEQFSLACWLTGTLSDLRVYEAGPKALCVTCWTVSCAIRQNAISQKREKTGKKRPQKSRSPGVICRKYICISFFVMWKIILIRPWPDWFSRRFLDRDRTSDV